MCETFERYILALVKQTQICCVFLTFKRLSRYIEVLSLLPCCLDHKLTDQNDYFFVSPESVFYSAT